MPKWLLLCLLLRLPAVGFADGFDYPDQQFQYVEPAWHAATGQALHHTWELRAGLRGQVYPWLLANVFQGLRAVGCDEPLATMRAVRFVHAVFSLLPMALFWLVVVRWRPIAAPRPSLLLFALSGLMVAGVQPSGPGFAALLALSAALALPGPRWWPAFGGLCLGLAFCARFQDALFGPGFLAALLWQRRYAAAGWFALGCVPGICLQGFADLAVRGEFLGTPWHYAQANLAAGAAAQWRTQPFWFYLLAGVVPVLALVPPFLRVGWSRLRAGAAVLPGALVGAAVHLGVHSFIARKALRFEHGAFMMLLAVIAVGLPAASGRLARWHAGVLGTVHLGLWLAASFWFGNAGAVRTALWLRAQPDFDGRVLVVGGDASALGGFFYSRPAADCVTGCAAEAAAMTLLAAGPATPPFVVAVREQLPEDLARTAGLTLAAAFQGQWDLREGERRFVYRVRR